jgi:hypothetical protein
MKTRKEIIKEILDLNSRHSLIEKQATLEYALQTMQDALLFSLAQDVGIELEARERVVVCHACGDEEREGLADHNSKGYLCQSCQEKFVEEMTRE